jgi:hypothetical protein
MPIATELPTIVQHVSRHLRVHPHACDTPEGIARWWVEQDDPVSLDAVEAALAWLAAGQAVEAQPAAADGRVRYRRATGVSDERLAQIEHDPAAALGPPQAALRGPRWH